MTVPSVSLVMPGVGAPASPGASTTTSGAGDGSAGGFTAALETAVSQATPDTEQPASTTPAQGETQPPIDGSFAVLALGLQAMLPGQLGSAATTATAATSAAVPSELDGAVPAAATGAAATPIFAALAAETGAIIGEPAVTAAVPTGTQPAGAEPAITLGAAVGTTAAVESAAPAAATPAAAPAATATAGAVAQPTDAATVAAEPGTPQTEPTAAPAATTAPNAGPAATATAAEAAQVAEVAPEGTAKVDAPATAPTTSETAPTPTAAPTAAAPTTPLNSPATAPAAAAAQTPTAPPAAQIAQVIAPLKLDADGVHRLSINLHPADLGAVNVVAELRNGDIHISLAGATDAGREALRAALPELRRELQSAGFGNTSFDMNQHAHRDEQPQRPGQSATPWGEESAAAPAPEQPAATARPLAGDRQLDQHV